MTAKRHPVLVGTLLIFLIVGLAVAARLQQAAPTFEDFWGPLYGGYPQVGVTDRIRLQGDDGDDDEDGGSTAAIRRWNRIAIDASGLDHTPVAPGETRVFGEQLGPGRSSKAMAIVHIAIFDAVNAIEGEFKSYTGIRRVDGSVSEEAAIAQAAHDTLVAAYPSQTATFDAKLAADLAGIRRGRAKDRGIALGQQAAAAILALRAGDGSAHAEPRVGVDFITSNAPGKWRQDPISLIPLALGAHWGEVRPFVLASSSQFRAPAPPAITTAAYATSFAEVKRLGGDGVTTPTQRTAEQTQIGTYWAYDGTPSLCAPPRLYNQIAMHIANQRGTRGINLARLLALVNTAMADAGIAIWESKYFYQYWRPVTGIRESDPGTGPTGAGDGNPATTGDPTFSPLGAPASNLTGPNFTPPFPAYPSGHAGFGGALFQVLRDFYRRDRIAFTFVSDEFNGTTRDNQGNVRPLIPRSFRSLSQAEEENGQSRIYL
ncbi:MAG TPA: vanadium-dependent haloperoxidase, partial [Blastocatellia bacterium]|nr:vanadium-dependent haloperoxidase [Blastocatellia bacterium]